MFCFQCQETAGNKGCTIRGVCGKTEDLAQAQDLLIWVSKGLAYRASKAKSDAALEQTAEIIMTSLFMTITNANFDKPAIMERVTLTLRHMEREYPAASMDLVDAPECAKWKPDSDADYPQKAISVGVLVEQNEDIRSLKELAFLGLKGMCAYLHHALVLGYESEAIDAFLIKALARLAVMKETADSLTALVLEVGKYGYMAMELLDKANTTEFGNPEISTVDLAPGKNPGILVSGHDLRDLEELLIQTEGTGVDVYTHSEMLPANYYPKLKKYEHLVGNYGSSWWHQKEDFEAFGGPILMTTNCVIPAADSYLGRLYTTGATGYPGARHIADREPGKHKDFSAIINQAKACPPPKQLETGSIVGGFAHNQVLALADKVVSAVKSGAIKSFVVMAGCDGRQKARSYYEDFAKALPKNAVILTAGCAKYRYNKLPLGDIGGIPRVLDAGQCNDSYSLVRIALALKDAFGLDDVNKLPIVYNIAWYEQKAVIVLLALLSLGVKNIHIGPTLPGFLSPAVAKVLIEKFNLGTIGTVEGDLAAFHLA
jgi:hydroxylamine reductase